jgi:hypothetical protein
VTSTAHASDAPAGVLLVEDSGQCWAWYGVRVSAAVDLREETDLPSRTYRERAEASAAADRAYLAAQLGAESPVELRWLHTGAKPHLELAVLGRVAGRFRHEVCEQALASRERLARLPSHVVGSEITDGYELNRFLHPFQPDPGGVAQLCKRWHVEKAQRPDTHFTYYVSCPWLQEVPEAPWRELLGALETSPHDLMISVGLQPTNVAPPLRAALSERATQFVRLSEAGRWQPGTGLWQSFQDLSPDAGAMTAAQLYKDAVHRYQDRVFLLRISVASAGPLPEALLTQIRETMSPPETGDSRGIRTAELAGSALEVRRPAPGVEAETAWQNITTLSHRSWDARLAAEPDVRREIEALHPLEALADVREAVAAFRSPAALDGVLPGFPVQRPESMTEVLAPDSGSLTLLLGRQRAGQGQAVAVPLQALTSHTLVVGATGSGKTSSVLSMLDGLWSQHHVPFLVIEPVNADRDDYRWLLDRPGFESMLVLTVGNEALAPFRLNPFEVPAGVRVGTHVAGLVACFDAAFGLWGPLPFLYRKALRGTYARAGISVDEVSGPRHAGRWPTLGGLVDAFATLPDLERYAGEVRANVTAASQLRAESLLHGSCGRTLDTSASYPIDELLRRPVVLELAAVGDDDREQALMIALLLNALTGKYKATRASSKLAHVTVIEEAHRLLRRPSPSSGGGNDSGDPSGRAAEQFANTLAENRKYGEALVIVEQVPAKLIEDAHKNTALKVMHHLPAEDDRKVIAETMNLTPDQMKHAEALAPMTALVTHRGMDGRAALVHVPDIRGDVARSKGLDEDPLPGPDLVRKRFEAFLVEQPDVMEQLAPYAACTGCAHRCQFRGIGELLGPAAVPWVRSRLGHKSYPPAGPSREAVWLEVAARFRNQADQYSEYTPEQRDDLAACAFMHATRSAWPHRDATRFVRHFRRAAQ